MVVGIEDRRYNDDPLCLRYSPPDHESGIPEEANEPPEQELINSEFYSKFSKLQIRVV